MIGIYILINVCTEVIKMNENDLKKLVDEYKDAIIGGAVDAERNLMALAREIERETRQSAVKMAYDLANNLNALKDS